MIVEEVIKKRKKRSSGKYGKYFLSFEAPGDDLDALAAPIDTGLDDDNKKRRGNNGGNGGGTTGGGNNNATTGNDTLDNVNGGNNTPTTNTNNNPPQSQVVDVQDTNNDGNGDGNDTDYTAGTDADSPGVDDNDYGGDVGNATDAGTGDDTDYTNTGNDDAGGDDAGADDTDYTDNGDDAGGDATDDTDYGADANGGDDTGNDQGNDQGTDADPDNKKGPGLEYDSTRKYRLFLSYRDLSVAIDNYIAKLENMMSDDFSMNANIDIATKKMREIKDLCYDYMTIKYDGSTYVESLSFYQYLLVLIQLVFDFLSRSRKKKS